MSTSIPAVNDYNHIESCLLIKITAGTEVTTFNSSYQKITYDSLEYGGLGHFLGISEIAREVNSTTSDLQMSISGIPDDPDVLQFMLSGDYKGARVEIRRAFGNPATGDPIGRGVYLRYSGYITGYSAVEDVDPANKERPLTINFNCASLQGILDKRVSGRRTNDGDQRQFFPNDASMSRVAALKDTNFDFGKQI
jgi:hypothetical protein